MSSTHQDSGPESRTVVASASLGLQAEGPGFVQGTIGSGGAINLDPFLSITEFFMSEPIFAPHPHAGFSAVTYMFPDSAGGFINRDSLGDRSLIGPGALHWTQAGAGMMHEEVPETHGVSCHGMQLFVNLRAADKNIAPRAFHIDAADVPAVSPVDGARVRVVLGSSDGLTSPLHGLAEPVGLVDIDLDSDVALDRSVDGDHRAIVLVYRGSLTIGEVTLPQHHLAVLDGPQSLMTIAAGADGASLLILTGRPMREPVVFGGSFVATDGAGIQELNQRFRRGEMGVLSPSFSR